MTAVNVIKPLCQLSGRSISPDFVLLCCTEIDAEIIKARGKVTQNTVANEISNH